MFFIFQIFREFQCSTWVMNMVIRREGTTIHTAMTIMSVQWDPILFCLFSLTFLQFFILLLLLCRSIISVGIRRKNNPLTCTDSAASWPNSAGNVNLLDLRTSQLQNSCIGMVISLESLTGQRGADSLPSPWRMKPKVRSTRPSTPATCRWSWDFRHAQASGGSRWWTQARRHRTTSSLMTW